MADDDSQVRATGPSGVDQRRAGRALKAEKLGTRLDPFLVPLGAIWAFAILAHNDCWSDPVLKPLLEIVSWAVYPVFVAEFVIRGFAYHSPKRFLRDHWWEVLILALPFLRFIRVLRIGRVIGTLARTGQSSGQRLQGRLLGLGLLHSFVILASATLLCDFGGYANPVRGIYAQARYLRALHDAAFGATSGQPLTVVSPLGQGLEVVLAVWSVLVFASLAAAFGDFFLRRAKITPGD